MAGQLGLPSNRQIFCIHDALIQVQPRSHHAKLVEGVKAGGSVPRECNASQASDALLVSKADRWLCQLQRVLQFIKREEM
eukprot:3359604-Amphidinium_carterae.2